MRPMLLVAGVGVALALGCSGDAPDRPLVRFEVSPGQPLTVVAAALEREGIIRSATSFRLHATVTGKQRAIQAGLYDLPRPASNGEIIRALTTGIIATNRFVVPEGLMISEILELVPQIGIAPEDFQVAVRDSGLRASLGIPGETLEGFLYPSTYDVPVGASARDLVAQMTREFLNQWLPEWTVRAAEFGFDRYEAVTLASIIEGEVLYGPDRGYVSSIYHNRMRRGMRLQADPTVIYALRTRRTLYERDYLFQSDYNTYLIDGLPPGPIGQPSAASIQAALYPEETDFIFMVADTTGKHIFSRTLREHNAHVTELRRIWSRMR